VNTIKHKRFLKARLIEALTSYGTLIIMAGIVVFTVSLAFYLEKINNSKILTQIGWRCLLEILFFSICSTASYVSSVWILIRSSGYDVTFVKIFLILHASLSANYVTPVKVGIPLRIYFYKHFLNITYSDGAAIVAVETIVGMLAAAALGMGGMGFFYHNLALWVPLGIVVLIIFIVVLLLFIPTSSLHKKVNEVPLGKLLENLLIFLDRIRVGFRRINIWALPLVLFLFCVNFFMHAMRLNVVLEYLGYEKSPLTIMFALGGSVAAGNISLLPMGLGVRDVTLVWFLLHTGIPRDMAVLGAMIQRLFTPGWPLVLGVISGNILGIGELKKKMSHGSGKISAGEI